MSSQTSKATAGSDESQINAAAAVPILVLVMMGSGCVRRHAASARSWLLRSYEERDYHFERRRLPNNTA